MKLKENNMELSEYNVGDRVRYVEQTMNPDDSKYPGSVVEVNKVNGEYMVLVKIDCKNLIYIVTADEPGELELMGV